MELPVAEVIKRRVGREFDYLRCTLKG